MASQRRLSFFFLSLKPPPPPPPNGDAPPPKGEAPPPNGDAPPPNGDAPPKGEALGGGKCGTPVSGGAGKFPSTGSATKKSAPL